MIERYTLPEMGAVWSLQNKFQKWLDVEIAVCEVHAEMGTIPADAVAEIKAKAAFTVERINELENRPITMLSRLPQIWLRISANPPALYILA